MADGVRSEQPPGHKWESGMTFTEWRPNLENFEEKYSLKKVIDFLVLREMKSIEDNRGQDYWD